MPQTQTLNDKISPAVPAEELNLFSPTRSSAESGSRVITQHEAQRNPLGHDTIPSNNLSSERFTPQCAVVASPHARESTLPLGSPVASQDSQPLQTPQKRTRPSLSTSDVSMHSQSPTASPLSPLTPPDRSPVLPIPSSSRTWVIHEHESSHTDIRTPEEAATTLAADIPQEEHNRYSLRTRKGWQLNPYKWDLKLYERQMKGIAGAMVPPAESLRRQRRGDSRGLDEGGTSDPDVDPNELDAEESETEKRRRRRSRSAPSGDDQIASVNGHGEHTQQPVVVRWKPAALNETFSSDSEVDEVRNEIATRKKKKAREEREAVRMQRKHRPKPFPLSTKAQGKRPARESGDSVGWVICIMAFVFRCILG